MRLEVRATLSCGQAFRWFEKDGWFYVPWRDRLIRAREPFEVQGIGRAEAARFFALDHDLDRIWASFPADEPLRRAIERFRGVRILRQDPWETLVSFVVSACSNIPRIHRDLGSMARLFGAPIRFGNSQSWRLPPAGRRLLAGPLRRAGLGYRAAYLAELSRTVDEARLAEIGGMPTEAARAALCELPGVGEKVAECVLLYGYGRLEAFPVDTRIRAAMTRAYFGGRRVPDRAIAEFGRARFGRYAGYAQLALYAWERSRSREPVSA